MLIHQPLRVTPGLQVTAVYSADLILLRHNSSLHDSAGAKNLDYECGMNTAYGGFMKIKKKIRTALK